MQKWEMREVFARKMRGVFAPSSSTFAPSSPTFAKKSRLAKSNANLIGYEQTTHVRSRSSMVKKQRRCLSQANVVKKNHTAAKQKTLLRISQHGKVFRAQKRAALAEKWSNVVWVSGSFETETTLGLNGMMSKWLRRTHSIISIFVRAHLGQCRATPTLIG